MQHVVVVDDEEISLRFLRNALADLADVTIHPFSSSAEALTWSAQHEVDCFVIDYHLPPPDGIEMIRRLRAMPAFGTVPIVLLTGEHEQEVRYRAFDAGVTDFVSKPFDRRELIARLTTMLTLRSAQQRLLMQVGWLQASLLDSEERAREHAERLEALWRLANNPKIGDEELIQVMLQRAVTSIRRDQRFAALLGRVDGDVMLVEALAGDATADCTLRVGMRLPLERTIAARSIGRGRTQSWDDLAANPTAPIPPYGFGWRAVISTHFTVGATTYALTFGSKEPPTKPFRSQDHAYVEILAQYFATFLQEQWQAAQIRYQLEHDSLTRLWNRSRFRSLGRAAVHSDRPAAVAVFDLAGFHHINETRGHVAGDAVLVEVGASLAAEATGDEIVARVGGDSFAVCFPTFASEQELAVRIARYRAVVVAPLVAVVGVAVGPSDGKTVDELLFRAEARARGEGPIGLH